MIEIKCRSFFVKWEKNLPDGNKLQIQYKNLSKENQTKYHIGVCEVFDQMVAKDDCREAKDIIAYIKGLK